jgi:hypothetical protein
MSTEITATTSSSYSAMTQPDLHDAIRKESTKARTKTAEAFDCMVRMGHLLIELKTRAHHGSFMAHAEHATGLPQRSINRYMAIAKDPDGFRNRRRGIPAEEMLTLTKKAPTSHNRIERETKVDTVSTLPATPSPRLPQITIEAEIVEPVKADLEIEDDRPAAPPAGSSKIKYTPEDGLMIQTTARSVMDRILPKDVHFEAAMKAMAKYCGEKIASKKSAPSAIEASEATLAEIVGLLPRLRPAETKELHRVLESRWLKGGTL